MPEKLTQQRETVSKKGKSERDREMPAGVGIGRMETLTLYFHGLPTWLQAAGPNKNHNPFPNLVFTVGSPVGHGHPRHKDPFIRCLGLIQLVEVKVSQMPKHPNARGQPGVNDCCPSLNPKVIMMGNSSRMFQK